MVPDDLGRLRGPALAPLWTAARRRLERSGLSFGTTPIRLTDLTADARDAISGLVGQRRTAGDVVKIDLHRLDLQLRQARGVGLVEILEAVDGPLVDRQEQRAAATATRSDGWRHAREHPAALRYPALVEWLDRLRRSGRLTRLGVDAVADQFAALIAALDVVEALPASPVSLAVLAVRSTGDAHGLDRDTPLGALATEAVEVVSGVTGRRAAWRAFGVELDAVSSSALVLGLRGHPILDVAAGLGEPVRITWRMLRHVNPTNTQGVVWVCENPVVVDAAATELGARCRPVVCTDGMPDGVVWQLLDQLRSAGVALRVHADFDIGGLRIAAAIIARTGALPWRFDTDAYLAAIRHPSMPLVGTPPPTSWDPPLRAAIADHRRAVHEEALLDVLLDDLAVDTELDTVSRSTPAGPPSSLAAR